MLQKYKVVDHTQATRQWVWAVKVILTPMRAQTFTGKRIDLGMN